MQLLPLLLYLFPVSGSLDKTCLNKTLVAHLREAVEPLNAECYQHTSDLQEGATVQDERY